MFYALVVLGNICKDPHLVIFAKNTWWVAGRPPFIITSLQTLKPQVPYLVISHSTYLTLLYPHYSLSIPYLVDFFICGSLVARGKSHFQKVCKPTTHKWQSHKMNPQFCDHKINQISHLVYFMNADVGDPSPHLIPSSPKPTTHTSSISKITLTLLIFHFPYIAYFHQSRHVSTISNNIYYLSTTSVVTHYELILLFM
jgi:hypothetical protein